MGSNEDSRELCAFGGRQENLKKVTDDGFLDNPLDNRWNKVVRGSAKTRGSRFVGGTDKKRPWGKAIQISRFKVLFKAANFNTDSMRIDITSNKEATYKSFRIIVPDILKDMLLVPEVWPVSVRVRDYNIARPNKKRSGPNNHGYRFQNSY